MFTVYRKITVNTNDIDIVGSSPEYCKVDQQSIKAKCVCELPKSLNEYPGNGFEPRRADVKAIT